MGINRKISKKEFLAILRKNGGLYSRTARAITAQYKFPYTRQAVRYRAEKYPEILKDIEEENLDVAEEGLLDIIHSLNEFAKLRAIELYLKTKGKKRGYIEKEQIEHSASDSFLELMKEASKGNDKE